MVVNLVSIRHSRRGFDSRLVHQKVRMLVKGIGTPKQKRLTANWTDLLSNVLFNGLVLASIG